MRFDITPVVATTIAGLAASAGVRAIVLTWDIPSDSKHAKTRVYYATTPDTSAASFVGEVMGNAFTHSGLSTTTRYYWVRSVNIYGREDGGWSNMATIGSTLLTELDIAASAVKAAALDVAGIDPSTGKVIASQIAAGTLAAGVVYAGSVTAAQIAAGSITTTQLQVGSASVVAGSNMVYNSWSPGGGFTGGLLTGSTAVTINTTGTPVSINCSVNVSAAASNPAVAYYLVTSYLVLDNVLYGNLFATTYMPAIGAGGWAKRGFASLPIVVRGGPAAGWHAFRIDTYFEPRDAAGNPVSHGSGFIDQHVYMTVTENKV